MKILLITLTALLFTGCFATLGERPEETKVITELGWNKVQVLYNQQIKLCTPVKTEECIITKEDAKVAVNTITSYKIVRQSCLVEGECNPCKLVSLISAIAAIAEYEHSLNVDTVCAGGVDLDLIIAELESEPEVVNNGN